MKSARWSVRRWSLLAVAPLALVLSEETAAAQMTQSTTFASTWTAVFTAPWYPSSPDSEVMETNWSTANRTTSITRSVGFKTAPIPNAGASLPLYACTRAAEQTRKTIRPYSSTEFAYNKNVAAYQSYIARDHGEFLANDAGCLATGATSRLLGYVVSPSEAVKYLKRYGGSLDPIMTCAQHGTRTTSTYGAKDYVLDAEVCSMPVFAGLSTAFWTQQTATGKEAPRQQVAEQNVRMFAIDKQGGIRIYSSNNEPTWGYVWNDPAIVGFWGTSLRQSFSNTSAYAPGGPFPTAPCTIDASFDPATAASQLRTSVTPAGACVLANLTAKLATLEGPAIAPPPVVPPAPPPPRVRPPARPPRGSAL